MADLTRLHEPRWLGLLLGDRIPYRRGYSDVVKGTDCMKRLRYTLGALALVLSVPAVGSAHASDESDVKTVIEKWVVDFNKGDMKSFLGSCASHTAIIDGFPPYAWDVLRMNARLRS